MLISSSQINYDYFTILTYNLQLENILPPNPASAFQFSCFYCLSKSFNTSRYVVYNSIIGLKAKYTDNSAYLVDLQLDFVSFGSNGTANFRIYSLNQNSVTYLSAIYFYMVAYNTQYY